MSVSLNITGIIPHDATYEKMYAVYAACEAAGVSAPEEVMNFFDHVKFEHVPDEREVALLFTGTNNGIKEQDGGGSYTIDLDRLKADQPHVKILRVELSY